MGHVFDEQVREVVENLPLDDGVRSLLQGCLLLTRFSVYLRAGGLSDKGVGSIGLRLMADGSRELERLELRGCPFGEAQIATSILTMWTRLKYLWVQGIGATANLGAALVSNKPGFLVEFMGETAQILGYYTLTQPRTDHPASVCLIYPEDKPREVNSQEMHEWTKCSGDA
jgi:coronatine-insensitive protein 1